MKKLTARKLSLSSETVRSLVADQLALVAGGRMKADAPFSNMWGACETQSCPPPDSVNIACPNTPNQ